MFEIIAKHSKNRKLSEIERKKDNKNYGWINGQSKLQSSCLLVIIKILSKVLDMTKKKKITTKPLHINIFCRLSERATDPVSVQYAHWYGVSPQKNSAVYLRYNQNHIFSLCQMALDV